MRLIQDRQCTYNAKLYRVHVTTVAIETQQCVPCVLLSYKILCAFVNNKDVLRFSHKVPDIVVRF